MKRLFLFLAFFCLTDVMSGQIYVDNSSNPVDFIVNQMFDNDVFEVTDYTFNGDTNAIAVFTSQDEDFPFSTGWLISSGGSHGVLGLANTSASDGGSYDEDLENLLYDPDAVGLNDCASLEITFTANSDSLVLPFTFASYDYPGFICSFFADPVGIFIKPDNPDAIYENIAVVPETDIPVNVNSINPGVHNNPQVCADVNPNWQESSVYYIDNLTQSIDLGFGGLTSQLDANAALNVGSSYKLKVAVCDAADSSWDTVLFIKSDASFEDDCPINEVNGGDICATSDDFTDMILTTCECESVSNAVDLGFDYILTDTNDYAVLDTIHIQTSVTNNGLQTSDEITLSFYWTQELNLDTNALLFHSVTIDSLAFQESFSYEYDFSDYPLPINEENYRIFVTAEAENESNEDDNIRNSQQLYFIENEFPLLSPSTGFEEIFLTQDDSIVTFEYIVYNGGYASFDSIQVKLFWSADLNLDEELDSLVGQINSGMLNPGDTLNAETSFTIPLPIDQPVYYLFLSAESLTRSGSNSGALSVPIYFSLLATDHAGSSNFKAWMHGNNGFALACKEESTESMSILLYDALGRLIYSTSDNMEAGTIQYYTIPQNLSSGVYILNLVGEKEGYSFKLHKF